MALPTPSSSTTCLVTGASSGIGAELARELAGRGHGVTLVARRKQRLEELAYELSSSRGVRTETIAADLTDPAARAALTETVAQRGLTVDVLVNNAGFSTVGRVYRATRERELDMIRTNVEAVVDLCTLFLPKMVERRSGAVLNVASTAAFQPLPGQAGYGASKSFVLSYTYSLRGELHGQGVTATALCPGPVRTEFNQTAGVSDEEAHSALPSFLWVPATDVAHAAIEGLARGRSTVIPGTVNWLAAHLAHMTPRDLIVPILASQHPAMRY